MSDQTYLYNSQQDFLCYVLIHAAEANNEISLLEKTAILTRTGHPNPADIHEYYLKHSEAEKQTYLESMRTKWVKNEEAKKALLENCRTVMNIDNEIDFMENAIYEQLIELLYV